MSGSLIAPKSRYISSFFSAFSDGESFVEQYPGFSSGSCMKKLKAFFFAPLYSSKKQARQCSERLLRVNPITPLLIPSVLFLQNPFPKKSL